MIEKSGVEMSALYKPLVQKFIVEKAEAEKFMVEKSRVERSGVEAWGWDVLQPIYQVYLLFLSSITPVLKRVMKKVVNNIMIWILVLSQTYNT